jgi:hypothetical protein
MSEHTPGPWCLVIDDTGGPQTGWPLCVSQEALDVSVVRQGGMYPYEWEQGISQRQAIANGHLIAAAPDMLELLNHIRILMKNRDRDPVEERLYETIQGVVAKAEARLNFK